MAIEPSQLSLVEDAPSLTGYEDAFGTTGYAANIAAHINATVTEHAFAIAVIGGWGTGKTDFLNRLRANVMVNNDDNVVLDFNPWKVKSDAIIEEFFKVLSEALRPFNRSITANIKDYSTRILQTGKEAHFRMLDVILNDMAGDDSLKKQYEKINNAIKLTGKRFVVIIDDLDRLTGKEIMEVLRIIRNTANFANTFFMVGMDKKYTIQVMANAKDFAYEEEYLKKIFQLTITLPAIKEEILVQEASKVIISDDMDAGERQAILEIIETLSYNRADPTNMFSPAIDPTHIMEKMVRTMRDLKRFANSFKVAYQILKGNVELQDLFVLELIRTRDIDAYNLLRDRTLLTFDVSRANEYILDEPVWKDGYGKKDNPLRTGTEINEMKQAIGYLLTPTGKKARKFADMSNFYLYFTFQHFNLIRLEEFNDVFKKDVSTIVKKFEQWIAENKGTELKSILSELEFFSSKEELLKMVMVYMKMDTDHNYWWDKASKLIFDGREDNKKQYFGGSDIPLAEFLNHIAADKSISNVAKAYQFHQFLKEEIEHSSGVVFGKIKLQYFMLGFLADELRTANDIQTSISILYNAWDSLDHESRRITLDQKALKLFKEKLLQNNELFKDYVIRIFRPYYTPYSGTVVFEPFVGKIFDDIGEFLEKIRTISFTDDDLRILKIEVNNRIEDFLSSDGKPFRIQDKKHKMAIEAVMRNNGIAIDQTMADLDLGV